MIVWDRLGRDMDIELAVSSAGVTERFVTTHLCRFAIISQLSTVAVSLFWLWNCCMGSAGEGYLHQAFHHVCRCDQELCAALQATDIVDI
jgi:hypothetical protein